MVHQVLVTVHFFFSWSFLTLDDSYCLTIISILLFQHEAQLIEDGITLSGFQQTSSRFESSDDDYADSDDTTTEQQYIRPAVFHPRIPVNKLSVIPPLRIKRERELKRRPQQNGWVFKRVWCLEISSSILFLLVTKMDASGYPICSSGSTPFNFIFIPFLLLWNLDEFILMTFRSTRWPRQEETCIQITIKKLVLNICFMLAPAVPTSPI